MVVTWYRSERFGGSRMLLVRGLNESAHKQPTWDMRSVFRVESGDSPARPRPRKLQQNRLRDARAQYKGRNAVFVRGSAEPRRYLPYSMLDLVAKTNLTSKSGARIFHSVYAAFCDVGRL